MANRLKDLAARCEREIRAAVRDRGWLVVSPSTFVRDGITMREVLVALQMLADRGILVARCTVSLESGEPAWQGPPAELEREAARTQWWRHVYAAPVDRESVALDFRVADSWAERIRSRAGPGPGRVGALRTAG